MPVEQAVSQKPWVPEAVGRHKELGSPKKNTNKCGGFIDVTTVVQLQLLVI